MTPKQKAAIKHNIKLKWLHGEITTDEYDALVKQLETLAAAGASLQEANTQLGLYKNAKKKASGGAMSNGQVMQLETQLVQMLSDKKITATQYVDSMKKLHALQAAGASYEDAMAAVGLSKTGMTQAEYIALGDALTKKLKAGLISKDEYGALMNKLQAAYKDKKTAQEIEKEIGCDPGTLATDDAIIKLGKEFKKIYKQAAQEMQAKLDDFLKTHMAELDELSQKAADGTITPEEAKRLEILTLQKAILGQKMDQLTGVVTNANQKAMAAVNGEMLGVFAENASWQSYQLTQDAKMDLMFSIYDERTAENLIKSNPKLLPPRKGVNGQKDQAWNRKMLAGTVAQAVIQGESIPKLARRIAADLSEKNSRAMMRYARTAMTGAQNAGRIEMLHQAEGMGIKVKKRWLATLDNRTRDSHQHMDGVSIGVDEEFKTPLGSKMQYPGDVNGKGGDVWNCRCTLVYDYEGFPNDAEFDVRRDNEDGGVIANMTYDDWKAAKTGGVLDSLSSAKIELAAAQKEVVAKKINEAKVYEGIWKDPVTLADYPAKAAAIQAKRDYYEAEIQKYKAAQAAGSSWATDEKIKELQKKLKLLNEFEKNGKLIQKRNAALKKVQDLYGQAGIGKTATAPEVAKKAKKVAKKAAPASGGASTGQKSAGLDLGAAGEKKTPFGPEAYSKERKDKALWSTDKRYVDSIMRPHTGEVWNKATAAEKDAIVEYTQSYSKYNEPLRGIEYGTSRYLGVGNTDLNAGRAKNGKRMNAMTDLIDKCSYDHDMWLQRGCGYGGMDKFFMCSPDLLKNGTQEELRQALLGTTPTEYAFGSMGSAKGKGFSTHPIIMNIYAPSGTKMMYVEPFSHYGGHMYNWDGKQGQSHFGDEFETLLQQGTQFRITKIERPRRGGTIYFDLEVINQDNQQRWKP